MNKRTVNLGITVNAPESLTDEQVARLVDKMLNVGYADAADTVDRGEGDLDTAEAITGIDITRPVVLGS